MQSTQPELLGQPSHPRPARPETTIRYPLVITAVFAALAILAGYIAQWGQRVVLNCILAIVFEPSQLPVAVAIVPYRMVTENGATAAILIACNEVTAVVALLALRLADSVRKWSPSVQALTATAIACVATVLVAPAMLHASGQTVALGIQ